MEFRMGKESVKGIVIYGLFGIFAIASLPLVGVTAHVGHYILILLINCLTVVIMYWSLLQCFKDSILALVGCLLFVWMPYRMDVLYGRADMYEAISICFLPLVLMGMYHILRDDVEGKTKVKTETKAEARTETKAEDKAHKLAWIPLVIGLSGMLQFHVMNFKLAVGLLLLLCVLNLKEAFSKKNWSIWVKVVLATMVVNVVLLFFMAKELLTDRTAIYLAGMEPIQHRGGYLLHYVTAFFTNGTSREFGEIRIQDTAPLGMGFAVTCLVLAYLWICFTGFFKEQRQKSPAWSFAKKTAVSGAVLLYVSTKYFPWDALRSSRIMQILTSEMQSPMELVPIVTICFIFVGCTVLGQLSKLEQKEIAIYSCAAVTGIALVTTLFLVGEMLEKKDLLQTPEAMVIEFVALTVAVIGCVLLGVYGVIAGGKQSRKEDDYVEKI